MIWLLEKTPCRSTRGAGQSFCSAAYWSRPPLASFRYGRAACCRCSIVSGETIEPFTLVSERQRTSWRATPARQWPHSMNCRKRDSFDRLTATSSTPLESREEVGREAGVLPGCPSAISPRPTNGRNKTPMHWLQQKSDLLCTECNAIFRVSALWCAHCNATRGFQGDCGVPTATYLLSHLPTQPQTPLKTVAGRICAPDSEDLFR